MALKPSPEIVCTTLSLPPMLDAHEQPKKKKQTKNEREAFPYRKADFYTACTRDPVEVRATLAARLAMIVKQHIQLFFKFLAAGGKIILVIS